MSDLKCTVGEFGVNVLDQEYPGGPQRENGAMIVTPPKAKVLEAIEKGKMITSRRIAMLESSHYVSHEQCVANAHLFAAAKELYAACQAVVAAYASDQLHDKSPLEVVKAALAKARGESS